MEPAENLADALVQICAGYLGARAATADNPDTYQVIIHAGAAGHHRRGASRRPAGRRRGARCSRFRGTTLPFRHPAHQDRCHLDDGPAISPAALALIGCNATISTMIHDLSGAITDVGRRTRKPPPALRRALRERDRGRCQYPGCDSRRTDAHHIRHWANGGQTSLANLISLCKGHHRLVHENGYIIATAGNGFAFYTKHGTPIPALPAAPARPRRHHHHPRRRHHPRHHQPPALRRAPQPLPRHLDRLRQRPHPSRPPRSHSHRPSRPLTRTRSALTAVRGGIACSDCEALAWGPRRVAQLRRPLPRACGLKSQVRLVRLVRTARDQVGDEVCASSGSSTSASSPR